jgi:hypothetical protein
MNEEDQDCLSENDAMNVCPGKNELKKKMNSTMREGKKLEDLKTQVEDGGFSSWTRREGDEARK